MSCNTKTSLAAVIDAVNAQLNNNYVDRDDPRIDQGVFTEPTIRGGLMLDEAAKLDFCGYVTECGQREPFGKQWVDRPLYPDTTLVSYEDEGEVKSRWQDIDDFISGLVTDTKVTTVPLPGAQGMIPRKQSDVNAERINVHDFGAIGDGTLHTVAEWTVAGSRVYFPNLAAIQAVYPHVTALTDSIDWTAIQACIDYCRSTDKVSTAMAGKNYIIDKTVVIRSNVEFNYSTFTISKDYVGAAVYLGNDPDSPSLLNGLRAKLPIITSNRSYLEPWVAGTKGVMMEGIRNCVITFEGVYGFETNIFGYSKNGTTGYSTANTFTFNGAYVSSKTNIHILIEESGWFNQCQWYNGHFGVLSTDHTRYSNIRNIVMQKIGTTGNNPPNGHTFTGCNMEGEGFEYTIQQVYTGMTHGFLSNNRWINCRFESSKRIHIDDSSVNDLFIASHMSDEVEFTGKVPSIIGQYNRGHNTIFLGAPKSGTRAANKSLHASGGQSGSNMINTWGTSGATINSGISGNGTYLVYNGADKSKLFPIMEFGKDSYYPSVGMGGGDSEITERIQRKGMNNWEFNFNLYPTTTNTYSLGALNQKLKDVYTEHLNTNRLAVWGALGPSSKPTVSGVVGDNTTLSSLLNTLNTYGLVDNKTTSPSAVKGSTESRPTTANYVGQLYLDTTLAPDGKPIWWNGSAWVDALGVIA